MVLTKRNLQRYQTNPLNILFMIFSTRTKFLILRLKVQFQFSMNSLIYSHRQLLTFDHALGFCCSESLNSPFLCPFRQEKVVYLKREPYYPLFKRSFETGQIFAMEGSRRVLVEGAPFLSTSTKTKLEPSMAKIRPVSKLLSNNG